MIKTFAAILLLACTMQASDKLSIWDTFYPEAVTKYGCHIKEATMGGVVGMTDEYWVLEGWAERKNMPRWEMALAYYPLAPKGRMQAMKECDKWMRQVDKHIKDAQPKSAGRLPAR
jgi:hypothetical protein